MNRQRGLLLVDALLALLALGVVLTPSVALQLRAARTMAASATASRAVLLAAGLAEAWPGAAPEQRDALRAGTEAQLRALCPACAGATVTVVPYPQQAPAAVELRVRWHDGRVWQVSAVAVTP